MTTRPVAISLGDPAGIGPEVVVRALAERPGIPVRVYGDAAVLERAAASAGAPPLASDRLVAVTELRPGAVCPGKPDDVSGRAQVAFLEAATDAVLGKKAAALVTAPISKEWAARAGFPFPGHTEYLAHQTASPEVAMMLAGPRLRVTVATTHLALRHVPTCLTADRISSAAVLTARALALDFGVVRPRVGVAGLNPHAGEGGRFGDEERLLVAPAIEQARLRLAQSNPRIDAEISGPHVPDVVFRQAAQGELDAVVALYHDQGLIPVKLLHFDEAVNLTLGLPFIRTSPDHGTAYDIAGTGRARAASFLAALDLAWDLVRRSGSAVGLTR